MQFNFSKVGTAVTNALINARKAVDKSSEGEVENVPILSTSVAYGVYMAVSSNLRYEFLTTIHWPKSEAHFDVHNTLCLFI